LTGPPVFLDPSGRRWRRIRLAALVLGALTSLAGVAVVAGILIPPLLPAMTDSFRVKRGLGGAPKFATTKKERERLAAKRRLFVALERRRPPLGVKTPFLPVSSTPRPSAARGVRPRPGSNPAVPPAVSPPAQHNNEVAGFYVNWDDNSFASFSAHASSLDWVVCEWGFLAPAGDSVRLAIDRKVLYVAQRQPPATRPRVLLMVGNFDSRSHQFDGARLRKLLGSATARASVVVQLTAAVQQYGLAGVTLDFEEIPSDVDRPLAAFALQLHTALAARGAILSQAISTDMDSSAVRAYAAASDRLFLMLYDEHFRGSDPGPVASQAWYVMHARQLLRSIPPAKAILALGAYGYDWNDSDPASSGAEMTFQDVMAAARSRNLRLQFDSTALNPFISWTEPDSTDHVVWFLDGVTAFNEIRAARSLGAAGQAIWRLGSEDPGVWQVLERISAEPRPQNLGAIPPGYDVKFDGDGEILYLAARPTAGHRSLRTDPGTGLINGEQLIEYPTPYVVERTGASAHQVALTFDDGPDSRWTPAILDTLASRIAGRAAEGLMTSHVANGEAHSRGATNGAGAHSSGSGDVQIAGSARLDNRTASTFSKEQYEAVVRKAVGYVEAGDIIQVVPSQRLSRATGAHPFTIYRALRAVNPSPYMYLLHLDDTYVVGASPEMLVQVEDGTVRTRPIAGTRPRGQSESEDQALADDLLADEKERAEHIMLVDLGRNDLGRVCKPGTVRVSTLMDVEKYSHVMHIVSQVEGTLRDDRDAYDALRSAFPAGTVSGAPKIRAMEVIAELEPCRRGTYAGAVGYFSYGGNLDTAITIRTMVVKDGVAHVQAGGGVVADSVPASEYQESLNKAAALLRALEVAEEIEAGDAALRTAAESQAPHPADSRVSGARAGTL